MLDSFENVGCNIVNIENAKSNCFFIIITERGLIYFPVRPEQARLVSCLLYGILVFGDACFNNNNNNESLFDQKLKTHILCYNIN